MRRRNEDTSEVAYPLGMAASQIRQARMRLWVAHHLSKDARARAAIEGMMAEVEAVARRADSMRLRLNAKAKSAITDITTSP